MTAEQFRGAATWNVRDARNGQFAPSRRRADQALGLTQTLSNGREVVLTGKSGKRRDPDSIARSETRKQEARAAERARELNLPLF